MSASESAWTLPPRTPFRLRAGGRGRTLAVSRAASCQPPGSGARGPSTPVCGLEVTAHRAHEASNNAIARRTDRQHRGANDPGKGQLVEQVCGLGVETRLNGRDGRGEAGLRPECQRSLERALFWTEPRPQHVGASEWASSSRAKTAQACAEPASRPSSPAKRGAKRRALPPVSTRARCWRDDARGDPQHLAVDRSSLSFRSSRSATGEPDP